jgi:hypothetical protein
MDGVFEGIAPGGKFTYEFTAEPFGVFPYHFHMEGFIDKLWFIKMA